jgi:hypothetical protein
MNRFAGVRRPKGRERAQGFKMTKDEMIDCFKSAPKGSRHQRMLWVARLTGLTEGGAYQMLLSALIEAEERGPIPGLMTHGRGPRGGLAGRTKVHSLEI